tara:strand:+ start:346 stop:786 length:441 start_codon:yes stop_codon:yes gene_type:complete
MSAASNYLENELLDHVLGENGKNFNSPSNLYLALFTSDGGLEANDSSSFTEISTSGSAYARKDINVDGSSGAFGNASGGSASNSQTITFSAATSNWGTVTHVAIMDSADSSGTNNVLFHGAVTTSKTIESGDTFQVSASNLTITLA